MAELQVFLKNCESIMGRWKLLLRQKSTYMNYCCIKIYNLKLLVQLEHEQLVVEKA